MADSGEETSNVGDLVSVLWSSVLSLIPSRTTFLPDAPAVLPECKSVFTSNTLSVSSSGDEISHVVSCFGRSVDIEFQWTCARAIMNQYLFPNRVKDNRTSHLLSSATKFLVISLPKPYAASLARFQTEESPSDLYSSRSIV